MLINVINLRALQADPAAFQSAVALPTGGGLRRFGNVEADFQRERFDAANPSLLAVTKGKPPLVSGTLRTRVAARQVTQSDALAGSGGDLR